jgi:hypothetical protein
MSSNQGADTRDRSSEYPRESRNRRNEERRRGEGPPPGVRHLSIIQYNCGNTNHRLARPLLDSLDPEKHHVLAIQEPYYNAYTQSTYCPRGFQLLYEPKAATRVCFMISKAISLSSWSWQAVNPDIAVITIQTYRGPVQIINVYNPRVEGVPQIENIISAISLLETEGTESILLGDMNLHHPRWGGIHVAAERQAECLLRAIDIWGLKLATPPGATTWQRGTARSTIDLTFMDEGLYQRLERCNPEEEWALALDHIPIQIQLNLDIKAQPNIKRYAIRKLKVDSFLNTVEQQLQDLEEIHPIPNERGSRATPEEIDRRLERIQAAIKNGLEEHCPVSKPGPYARHAWSAQCAVLVASQRRARRKYTSSHNPEDERRYKDTRNQLKNTLKKEARNSWRRFINEHTTNLSLPHNKGLWRMAKWAKRKAGRPVEDPHLPPLRRPGEPLATSDNDEKAKILTERFFPQPALADLSDITGEAPVTRLRVDSDMTTEEMARTISRLSNNTAPGPDGIPNEALKTCGPLIAPWLADVARACFAIGYYPRLGRAMTTFVLRKEGKADYSFPGSYRPIALENTLSKILEKVIADRMADTAEEHALLPQSQMGARKNRSTLSALTLLAATIKSAWAMRRDFVVSMLSLDISGAYDNVPHERLLYILRAKGFPEWIVKFVQGFTGQKETSLVFSGYQSPPIAVATGIPQGSPLSPILFLFFVSNLLNSFEEGATQGIGFVDDTNLITYGPTAAENCRILEKAHDTCIEWARRHGVQFSPEKYQLIHFTRKRNQSADLQHTIRIQGFGGQPVQGLRVLGVWVDSKLQWSAHAAQAARKGQAQYIALSRIVNSTWGPCFQRSRLLYTAVVRPTMTYGSSVWAIGESGKGPPKSLLKPLQKVQTACLRSITGGYKRTATALLEKEANIPPLQLYVEAAAMQRAQNERNSNVTKYIKTRLNKLWRDPRAPRRRINQQPQSREDILEKQVKKAEEEWCCFRAQAHIEEEGRRARGQQRQQQERERSQSRARKNAGKLSIAMQY